MTAVGVIDLVSFVTLAVAVVGIVRGWKRWMSRDSMLLLLAIATAALLHAMSNALEWSGITAVLDPYEDYLQIVEPILWFFFMYSFLRTKETEDLRESEERYRALYEDLPDAVFLADADSGTILGANQAATRLLDRQLDGIVGLNQTDLHPADVSQKSREIFSIQRFESERTGHAKPVSHSIIRSDGEHVPVEISSRLVHLSGRSVMQGVFRDISARRKAAELLRKEKEQAQKYLDVAGAAFIALNREGRITLINQRGLEILEYESDRELLGREWFETCIPPDIREALREVFAQMMAGEIEATKYYENPILTRNSEVRIITWHSTILTDDDGNPIGTLSSGEDITEQRKAEQERMELEGQLRQAQKLESIGTLASGVAHEINNPLTSIIGYAQLIHDRTEKSGLRDYAQGIIEEGNRVANIVKSLLSFSRQESERHSPVSMSDLIDSALALIGSVLRKDQIQLTIEIASDLPLLKCRSQQMQQVLINLLTNARDALNDRYPEFDKDKTLRISVELIRLEDGSWIRTIIEDHGSGIPADIVERIFDPFFSTKPREKGTGLGLSISYGLVRDHHGRLLVESEPDAYTRVIMDLPVENE
ncbi:PAS domain S-box protein [Candidatus Bipolaricaulota bacterium]